MWKISGSILQASLAMDPGFDLVTAFLESYGILHYSTDAQAGLAFARPSAPVAVAHAVVVVGG